MDHQHTVIKPTWYPQVGQLVKRIDSDKILGTIAGFAQSQHGVMVDVTCFPREGESTVSRQALGIMEPVSIEYVISQSAHPIHRVIEKNQK